MNTAQQMVEAMGEPVVARKIHIPHDERRMRYKQDSNTVDDFHDYGRKVGHFYNYQYTGTIAIGGTLSPAEAEGRAKEIIEHEYRRRGGDIVTAYNDAHDGTNGGLRAQFDLIAERLKLESVERYVRAIFDQFVQPSSYEDQVEVIRQLLATYGPSLGSAVDRTDPKRYARNYQELIRAIVESLQRTSSVFRRL